MMTLSILYKSFFVLSKHYNNIKRIIFFIHYYESLIWGDTWYTYYVNDKVMIGKFQMLYKKKYNK